MLSIEIVCVGQQEPLEFNAPFLVWAERELISHRSPAIFQDDFDALEGCIYHLGVAYHHELKPWRPPQTFSRFAAYELLHQSDGDRRRLVFRPGFMPDVLGLLGKLLEASPYKRLVWTTDYQFGQPPRRMMRPLSLARFERLHGERKLWLNTLYTIKG